MMSAALRHDHPPQAGREESPDWHQPRWLIAQTKRMAPERMERWLEDLRGLGFEAYYPMVRAMMKVPLRELSPAARRARVELRRPRVAPFLPQRVFVREGGNIYRLEGRPGFIGLIAGAGEPVRILHRFIAKLKRREIDGVIPGGTPAEYVFSIGEEVDLLTSFGTQPAKVLEIPKCAIEDIDADTVMRFTIEMFGRPIPVYGSVGDARKRI